MDLLTNGFIVYGGGLDDSGREEGFVERVEIGGKVDLGFKLRLFRIDAQNGGLADPLDIISCVVKGFASRFLDIR